MNRSRWALAAALVSLLLAGSVAALHSTLADRHVHVTAYFPSTNGLYPGDQVRILGVPVGGIDTVTAGQDNVKVTFWFDRKYQVPADATAAILSPAVVSARVVQLTPAYTGGPLMTDNAVIPEERTAVPVEYDDLREQLQKLTDSLQPVTPDGLSPLGEFIKVGADNLQGQGTNIRDALSKLSQALSALGDHSKDIFGTVRNLSLLVTALQSSADALAQLNRNLAAVTNLLSNQPNEVGQAVTDLDSALGDVKAFLADNRETVGITFDKLASLTTAVHESLYDIKQALHVGPNALANFANIYRPGQAATVGVPVLTQFSNPIQFICSGIQAASRMNYEQSAKLCVQYLAPILKDRQYNFPPIGTTIGMVQVPIPLPLPLPFPPFLAATLLPIPLPVVGAMARPNELTYSEDWLRPDYRPTPAAPPPSEAQAASTVPVPDGAPLPAEAAIDAPPVPQTPAELTDSSGSLTSGSGS